VVVNRTAERARRLALSLGARTADPGALSGEISRADLLLSSTGASGFAVPSSAVRPRAGRPLVVLDLAVPRDVAPVVGARAGVTYVDLETLRSTGPMASDDEVRAAAAIVAGELRKHLEQQRQRAVTPTVTALRARANQVIDAELRRIEVRLPGLDDTSRREVAGAVRRAVEKVGARLAADLLARGAGQVMDTMCTLPSQGPASSGGQRLSHAIDQLESPQVS